MHTSYEQYKPIILVPHSQQCMALGHTSLDSNGHCYIGQPPIVPSRVSGLEGCMTMLHAGAFPFGSATFVSFLLPIHPSDLSYFTFAFVHSLHICLGSLTHGCLFFKHSLHLVVCVLGLDSSCTGGLPTTLMTTTLSLATNQ